MITRKCGGRVRHLHHSLGRPLSRAGRTDLPVRPRRGGAPASRERVREAPVLLRRSPAPRVRRSALGRRAPRRSGQVPTGDRGAHGYRASSPPVAEFGRVRVGSSCLGSARSAPCTKTAPRCRKNFTYLLDSVSRNTRKRDPFGGSSALCESVWPSRLSYQYQPRSGPDRGRRTEVRSARDRRQLRCGRSAGSCCRR